MNQEIPKNPEPEKAKESIPLDIAIDTQKKLAIIDNSLDSAKLSPDLPAIEKSALKAKNKLTEASLDAQKKLKDNEQNTLAKINTLS